MKNLQEYNSYTVEELVFEMTHLAIMRGTANTRRIPYNSNEFNHALLETETEDFRITLNETIDVFLSELDERIEYVCSILEDELFSTSQENNS
jgi:hypothetical protein